MNRVEHALLGEKNLYPFCRPASDRIQTGSRLSSVRRSKSARAGISRRTPHTDTHPVGFSPAFPNVPANCKAGSRAYQDLLSEDP
jgi:hypothetical protein